MWAVLVAYARIPPPSYWSHVTLINQTGRPLATDHFNFPQVAADGITTVSGEKWGTSMRPLRFRWWYGNMADESLNYFEVKADYPKSTKRGDYLEIIFREDGTVELVATARKRK